MFNTSLQYVLYVGDSYSKVLKCSFKLHVASCKLNCTIDVILNPESMARLFLACVFGVYLTFLPEGQQGELKLE